MMRGFFGSSVLNSVIKKSELIKSSAEDLMTTYEIDSADVDGKTWRRCQASMKDVHDEILGLIKSQWKSYGGVR